VRSGDEGRCTRLRVRTGTSVGQPEGKIEPGHLLGNPIDVDRRDLRYIDGCTGLQHAANRTASVMGAVIDLVGLPGTGSTIAMADHGPSERIGSGNARRPARADGCKNLHHQGNQDNWQKILQPPAHRKPIPLQTLITFGVRSRDEVPGTMLQLQGEMLAKSDAFYAIWGAPYLNTKHRAYCS
jgi:hypothetical protein